MLTAAGNINEPYEVVGVVHAMASRSPQSEGFGKPKVMPVMATYQDALSRLTEAAARSGANGVIHVAYEQRLAVGSRPGCTGDKTEQVLEVYAWGTAVILLQPPKPVLV